MKIKSMLNKVLLDTYNEYLISAIGQTTGTGMGALLDGRINHLFKRSPKLYRRTLQVAFYAHQDLQPIYWATQRKV